LEDANKLRQVRAELLEMDEICPIEEPHFVLSISPFADLVPTMKFSLAEVLNRIVLEKLMPKLLKSVLALT
jgi:hypothetical protein